MWTNTYRRSLRFILPSGEFFTSIVALLKEILNYCHVFGSSCDLILLWLLKMYAIDEVVILLFVEEVWFVDKQLLVVR